MMPVDVVSVLRRIGGPEREVFAVAISLDSNGRYR